MSGSERPKPPAGLDGAGKALWRAVQGGLPGDHEFDERESELLRLACAQVDDVAALEAIRDRDGMVVTGSTGQARLSQVVTELRQARLAAAKLLAELDLGADGQAPGGSVKSQRARKAAQARWMAQKSRRQIA